MTDHASHHAFVRGAERLPFVPDAADFRLVIEDILAVLCGEVGVPAVLLKRQPDGNELWATRMRGHPCRVVYAPDCAVIITVLNLTSKRGGKRRDG